MPYDRQYMLCTMLSLEVPGRIVWLEHPALGAEWCGECWEASVVDGRSVQYK